MSITNSTGAAPFTYDWNITSGGGQLTNQTTATPTLQLPGSGTVQVQLTITDDTGCVALSNMLSVPINTPTGILQASLNNVPLVPDYDYGLALPTYDLCQAPPPGSTAFTFTGLSTGANVLQVDLGSGFVTATLPMVGNFTPGLDTVRYIIQDPVTLCIDTLQVGVLVGTPNVTYTMSVAASQTPFRGCTGDSVEFTINTPQGFQPGTGYIIAYNDNGYVPVDTIFPDSDTFNFWRVFAATSCPYSVGAIQHTYDLQVRTIYGCTQDFASGNASSIFISEAPDAELLPPDQNVCVGSGPVNLDNQSSGVWIQGNNCVPAPNFYYEVLTGTQGTDWTPNNNLGSANNDPLNPPAWTNGSDPLSLSFLHTGQYAVRVYAGGSGSCPIDYDDVVVCVDTLRNVGFTSNTLSACGPVNVSLTDTTNWNNACGTQTYAWQVVATSLFCGGPVPPIVVPPVADPQFTLTVPGVYQVTMQVNTPCGLRTQVQDITVYGPPNGTLGALPPTPCVGDVITLTSTSSGCGDPGFSTQYVVLSGNATITGDQLSIIGPGPIVIGLQAQNACTSGLWQTVATQNSDAQGIPATPQATITPNPVCAGASVTVDVVTQPGVSAYTVTWPGGSVNGTQASFTAVGNITITVQAGPTGCDQTADFPLTVVPITPIGIVSSALPVCAGDTVDLIASGPGTSYDWLEVGTNNDLGDGPTLQLYPTAPISVALLDTINGCPTGDTLQVLVNPLPTAVAPPDVTLCSDGTPYTLPVLPAGGDYTALSGAFSEPDLISPTAGVADVVTVTLTVTDANNCQASDDMVITIANIVGAADAGPDLDTCWNNTPVVLGGSGDWQDSSNYFVDGILYPALTAPGIYTLTTCATQCVNLCDQMQFVIHDTVPVEMPDDLELCEGTPGLLLDAGPYDGDWSGSDYLDEDGNWDNASAPVDTYVLEYEMTDPNGCVTTGAMVINVNPPPTAGIGPMAPCVGQAIVLANTSTGSNWSWLIDGVDILPVFDTSYTFNTYGDHEVILTASDANGCADTDTVSVFVDMAPTIDVEWTVLDSCGEGLVQAVDQPFLGASQAWSLNDVPHPGPPFVLPAPIQNDTTYTLGYAQWNDCDSLVATFSTTIRPLPVAGTGIGTQTLCVGDSLLISDQSYGGVDSMLVQFGDGTSTTSMDSVLYHVYDLEGTYNITRIAYGPCGSESIAVVQVTVLPNVVVALIGVTDVDVCAGDLVSVQNISVGDTAVVIHWGDPDNNTTTIFEGGSFNYTEPGEYTVMLVAFGCGIDTTYTTITVNALPSIALDDLIAVCDGDPVQFNVLGAGLAGVTWDFADGSPTSELIDPLHLFPGPGTYTVTVNVQDQGSLCPQSDSVTVVVRPTPLAQFTVDTTAFCLPFTLSLTNTVQAGVDYEWLVDDLPHSFAPEPPARIFDTEGPHTITLIATYPDTPCADTTAITVYGNETPTAAFSLTPVDSCASTVQLVTTNISSSNSSATWYVDEVLVGNDWDLNTSYTGTPGDHTLALVVTSAGGCTGNADTLFHLAPLPNVEFTWSPLTCTRRALDMIDRSTDVVFYEWLWDGGPSSAPEPTTIQFDTTGTYPITLIGTAANGCVDSLTRDVDIFLSPTIDTLFITGVPGDCGMLHLRTNAPPESEVVWQNNPALWGSDVTYDAGSTLCELPVCVRITLGICPADTCTGNIKLTACNEVFVPNSFTPDGNGFNDVFMPVLGGLYLSNDSGDKYLLNVFDRWGVIIFESTDPHKGWDGNGHPIGVYPWQLTVRECNGQSVRRTGHVTLVR